MPKTIKTLSDFSSRVPPVSKKALFGSGSFASFSVPGYKKQLSSMYTSSGFTRSFAFGESSRKEHGPAASFMEDFLFRLYDLNPGDTLVINALSLGTDIPLRRIPQVHTGVRQDSVIETVRKAKGEFNTIVLVGEPHLLKRIVEDGIRENIRWDSMNVLVVTGSEFITESWRIYIETCLGKGRVISTMGITEVGLAMCFETHPLIELRRCAAKDNTFRDVVCGPGTKAVPLLMHYLPGLYHIEAAGNSGVRGEMLVTCLSHSRLVPLVRYSTGDQVLLLSLEELSSRLGNTPLPQGFLQGLPTALVWGRLQQLNIPGGDWISPLEVKDALFTSHAVAEKVTGNFRLVQKKAGGPVKLTVQLSPGEKSNRTIQRFLQEGLAVHTQTPIPVTLAVYREFPYGFEHDFERKNQYIGSE